MEGLHAGDKFSYEKGITVNDSVQDSLTPREWKKFKYFEAKLQSSQLSQKDQVRQLTGYARDSLIQVRNKDVDENLDRIN